MISHGGCAGIEIRMAGPLVFEIQRHAERQRGHATRPRATEADMSRSSMDDGGSCPKAVVDRFEELGLWRWILRQPGRQSAPP